MYDSCMIHVQYITDVQNAYIHIPCTCIQHTVVWHEKAGSFGAKTCANLLFLAGLSLWTLLKAFEQSGDIEMLPASLISGEQSENRCLLLFWKELLKLKSHNDFKEAQKDAVMSLLEGLFRQAFLIACRGSYVPQSYSEGERWDLMTYNAVAIEVRFLALAQVTGGYVRWL